MDNTLRIVRILVSFLLLFSIVFTFTACVRVVSKSESVQEGDSAQGSDTGDDSGWELNEDDAPAKTAPSGNGNTAPPPVISAPATTTPPATTPAASTPVCDLTIQPATLNAAPGIYTFTASAPSFSNPVYQWDISGLISQSGPQNTFTVNMNSPGTGTVSVTLIINGRALCKATSNINIVQAVPQCDLKIQPASLNANLGTYTFWAITSYSNALFIWDINGYQQAYGPEPSFSVTFKSAGSLTVSVTMVINGVPVCKASSAVNVVPIIIK